jgi:hypothetical protein
MGGLGLAMILLGLRREEHGHGRTQRIHEHGLGANGSAKDGTLTLFVRIWIF